MHRTHRRAPGPPRALIVTQQRQGPRQHQLIHSARQALKEAAAKGLEAAAHLWREGRQQVVQ